MTRGSVLTVLASEVPAGMSLECIVLDNGSDAVTAQMLDSLEARHDGVRVVHAPTNFGYAVGNNLAVGEARGDTVVFLNNDTKVDPGWLPPAGHAVWRTPTCRLCSRCCSTPRARSSRRGGVPGQRRPALRLPRPGSPSRTPPGSTASFSALTGASRRCASGRRRPARLDPLFRNGMEDVDLCLRLARLRPGRCGSSRPRW